ncbi:MAG: outer membrane lipoprotein-sorting protein [Acidobacteriia bacterium]|nr:outer membrane lipoprotein-sorting protein [Terriglobia bacterium]
MALRITILGALVCLLAAVAAAQANPTPAGSRNEDARNIVDRMLRAQQDNKARVRAFTVKRGYHLYDKQQQEKAQVVANITVLPPDGKEYQVESSSGGMGEKVLRDILSKETESPRDAQRKELSPENYDFQLLGQEMLDGRQCYLLGLNPKREDKDLLRGKIWVDAENYNIRRLEGSPVKNPSWWVHDIHILMSFADVDGMWLRTFTHAVANVRFKGKYVMESRDLEYSFTQETASRHRRHDPGILAGSAINP